MLIETTTKKVKTYYYNCMVYDRYTRTTSEEVLVAHASRYSPTQLAKLNRLPENKVIIEVQSITEDSKVYQFSFEDMKLMPSLKERKVRQNANE